MIKLIFSVFLFTFPCAADTLQTYIEQSKIQNLSEDLQWKALLHYDKVVTYPSEKSRSVDDSFFLSPKGKYDPQEELNETLKTFLTSEKIGDDHPICKFPARYEWLKEKLSLPDKEVNCPRLTSWMEGLNTDTVTVIFPASFINNPASAFGHTFIRIDQKNQNDESRLLSYTADFSAQTFGEDALTYATKGIFGGYTGKYSVAPYYKKVTQYSDLENRDIWEYTLSFSDKEAHMLALHFWELRDIGFTYFYFDENCSYHILALLQVARPSLKLTETLKNWVIPVDTIRVLQSKDGLIKKTIFRPSAATKLRARIDATTKNAQKMSINFSQTNSDIDSIESNNELSDEEKAQSLDLAYDLQTYEAIKNRDESSERKKHAWKILAKRSKYPPKKAPEVLPPVPSEEGHKTARLSVGTGKQSDRWVSEVSLRPAFHDLLDPAPGYLPGSQISFFETTARFTESEKFSIEKFKPLQIVSLSPRDEFFHPLSWHVLLEERRIRPNEKDEPFIFSLSSGAGRTYKLGDTTLVYGFMNGAINASGVLDENYSLGAGPQIGVIYTLNNEFAVEGSFSAVRYAIGDYNTEKVLKLSTRYSYDKDRAVRFDLELRDEFDRQANAGFLRWQVFFTP